MDGFLNENVDRKKKKYNDVPRTEEKSSRNFNMRELSVLFRVWMWVHIVHEMNKNLNKTPLRFLTGRRRRWTKWNPFLKMNEIPKIPHLICIKCSTVCFSLAACPTCSWYFHNPKAISCNLANLISLLSFYILHFGRGIWKKFRTDQISPTTA